MAKVISEGLNQLPRLNYRWLKLNEFKLREPLAFPIQPYTLDYLPPQINGEVKLKKMGEKELSKRFALQFPGVASELVEFAEKEYNSGFILEIPAGKKIAEPLLLQYNLGGKNNSLIDYNTILAEKNSSVTINIEYLAADSGQSFHNGVTKIIAEEGAEVTLVKIQKLNDNSFHFDSHYVEIGPYATVRYIQVEMGGEYSVTNYATNLADHSIALVDGMYFGDGDRVLDLSYHMLHYGFRSKSDILVKGALQDRSRKVFRGTLDFKRGAQLADGNEEEYVLLLDPTVKSDAVPLLLSEEDDVQGGHAASAGKVNQEQLFYLLTRGLAPEQALETLVKASYQPILDQLSPEQRSTILEHLQGRLRARNV